MLKDEEIAKIKLKSTYEEDDWLIPPFVLRAKEVHLPKVNGRAMVEREKDERELEFRKGNDINAGDIVGCTGSRNSTGDSESDGGGDSYHQH